AGSVPEELKAEVLAERLQVPDDVVDKPGSTGHEQEQHDDLDGHRPIPRIVDEHAQTECVLWSVRNSSHVVSPPGWRGWHAPVLSGSRCPSPRIVPVENRRGAPSRKRPR